MTDTIPRSTVPQRYLEALGGVDPIEAQRKAPKRVKKLVKGLSEKQLSKRPGDGQWSIKEIIGHLVDSEFVNGTRVRFIAAHDRPAIPSYDENLFAARLGNERARTKDLLEAFAAVRAANLGLLERLPKGAMDRVGIHSERGEESIRTIVAIFAGHDHIHERQIERVREFLKAAKKAKKAVRKSEKSQKKAAKDETESTKHAESKKSDAKSDSKKDQDARRKALTK